MIHYLTRQTVIVGLMLLVSLAGVKSTIAQEAERVMIMPVAPKTAALNGNLADFTAQVREYFRADSRFVVLGDDQLQSLLGSSTGINRQLVQVAGDKLGCKVALQITLDRYRERLGDEYSVTDPASLAFEYQLTNVVDGKVVCFGQFSETQQPVSENVLAIGQAFNRGFKWITIADLTREAFKRKFGGCLELTVSGN